ncbi:C39 family peptidase [Planococcus sp. ISL-109]|uniref:C39 family peptidase n=1 Tax=Planococcus sp. ISL-109 TaxID=2819166 RepID=UPI001BE77DCE|nr:C39 family peptidase [Planococcus sp. ISL-109]MBT2581182.1 C39 family peptidase [Planococcus sp. ISL-109]
MMATVHIETADDMIRVIGELWAKKSLRAVKEFLGDIPTEDEFYRLIRMADETDLYGYSNLLASTSYKRFGTLRSYAWHCARLAETGRSLEAEEKMLARLQGIHAHAYDNEDLLHAHHLLLKVYCQLNRIPEAQEQLVRITELGEARPDQQAFFAIYSGEWDQAQQILVSALDDTDRRWSTTVHLLYADLLSMRGAPEQALELLGRGEARFPDVHAFRTEQIGRLHQLGRYSECLAEMDGVLRRNPYHSRKKQFIHLAAHCLYQLERFEELEKWIDAHPGELKESLYTKAKIDPAGQHKKLPLRPEVQKLNYCVPASLSLMLQAFGKTATQDDIAAHVFDVTGSKLQTTMTYMETQGFTAHYFKGTIGHYKTFIDEGVPVLLSMMIENSAHVQVVVGYDDRLQALAVQDPNDLGPFLIAYDEVPKMYRLSDGLSMVFLDESRQELASMLDKSEHRFFTELYDYLDEDPIDEEKFTKFLAQHENERYAAVVGLTLALPGQNEEWHDKWLTRLYDEFGQDDAEIALLAAHLYFQKEQGDKALDALKKVPHARSPYALFLQAAISMNEGHTEQAIPLLKRSIELDHYQPLAYSHLARCYLESGRIFQAYKWSNIAINQLPEDVFAQITHGLIQFEYGAIEQAFRRFKVLSEAYPDDGYFLYEMGRCEQALEKTEDALRTYRRALALDPSLPFAYLRMAELFMEEERWGEAQAAIEQGLAKNSEQDILHLYLGHIATEQHDFTTAEAAYKRALELDPNDLFTPVHIAHALFGQKRDREALRLLTSYLDKADAVYRVLAADITWDQVKSTQGKLQALLFIEGGFIDAETQDLRMLAKRYADFGTDPSVRHGAIAGLKGLRGNNDPHIYCLEAELHEMAGNWRFAKRLYEQAGNFPLALQKLGLMSEEAQHYEEAIGFYERATEQEAGFAQALGGLVRCYQALEKNDKAFAAALDYLSAEPLSAVLWELAEFADSEVDLKRLSDTLTRIEDQVPAEWLLAARAHVAEAAGDMESAQQYFERAGKEPGAFPSRYQYAQFLNRNGEAERAANFLEELLEQEPEETDLYEEYIAALEALNKVQHVAKRLKKALPKNVLGQAYLHAADQVALKVGAQGGGQADGWITRLRLRSKRIVYSRTVIKLCDTAAELMPESDGAALRLGQFYLMFDLPKDALKELKPFAEKAGEAKRLFIYASLQHAHETKKPRHFKAVIEQLEQFEKQRPLDGEMLAWWSEALDALSCGRAALGKLDRAIRLEPFNPDLYTRKWHMLESFDPSALAAFEDSLPEELRYAEWLILARASTYSTKRDGKRAKELLEPLLRDSPDFVPAQYELARAEAASNNPLGAKVILRQLLATDGADAVWEMVKKERLFETILVEFTRR